MRQGASSQATGREISSRRVTMEDVGRMAGVSQVTVSRALSDPSKVSAKTHAKIQKAIEATGFVPNAVAGALASSKSKLVSALIPSLTNITYTAVVKEFVESLRQHDYQVLLSETGHDSEAEATMIARHLSRRPDAILLTGISHTSKARRMLLAAEIPVIEVWDITESPIDKCVGFSHNEAGRAVAEFAMSNGYEVAASVTANDERALRRHRAFSAEFERQTGRAATTVVIEEQASIAGGRQGLCELIDRLGEGTGVVFCSSDLLAHGVMIEAQVRGLRIPEDVAVIGFGDQDFAQHLSPALTTVRVDRARIGQVAAQSILRGLKGENSPLQINDLGFEIIKRQSA